MTLRQKLETIKELLGLTQTQLADKLGVSFVAFNNWWTGKYAPRPKMLIVIEDLFLEVTGQKIIPVEVLESLKNNLRNNSSNHKNVILEILDNPDIRDEFILKLTYHTNSIEGSTLTEADTEDILFNNIALADKSLSEQLEARNHQTALNYLFEYISKRKKINEELILKLHSILMNGIRPDAGLYRNHGVRILGVSLPTANYVSIPSLIIKLVTDINSSKKQIDVVSAASDIHSRFEKIHPFSDGNGRVGRLLMNAMLLEKNFAPAVIRQEKKRLYYTYLYKAQTKNDLSQLDSFLCEAIAAGFNILERKNIK